MTTADAVFAAAPYARTLGVQFVEIGTEQVVAAVQFSEDLSTVGGGLHGGVLMGLADVAAAVCAVTNSAPGARPATTTSATQFIRPVRGTATATATALHTGRSAVVVNVDVRDDDGRLCVRVTQTVAVLSPAPA